MTTQSIIQDHWCTVLDVTEANPEDNFFELGGHSLMAIELIQRIEVDLDVQVPIDPLFTDGSLAALLEAAEKALTK